VFRTLLKKLDAEGNGLDMGGRGGRFSTSSEGLSSELAVVVVVVEEEVCLSAAPERDSLGLLVALEWGAPDCMLARLASGERVLRGGREREKKKKKKKKKRKAARREAAKIGPRAGQGQEEKMRHVHIAVAWGHGSYLSRSILIVEGMIEIVTNKFFQIFFINCVCIHSFLSVCMP
jgi:hypothetical protein